MAMMRLYQMQSYMVNHSVPGVATDVMALPHYYRSNADIQGGMEVVGTPAAVIYSEPLASIPGVRSCNWPEINELRKIIRKRVDAAILAWRPINQTVLLQVDITPVFVQKLFDEVALENRRIVRERQGYTAATAEGRGDPLYSIAFTTYNMTVCYLMEEIQRHMLEPIIDCGQTWQLWTENEVLNYLRERISRFLMETRVVVDREVLTSVVGQSSYDLSPTLAELRRVELGGNALVPLDYWSADNGIVGWQNTPAAPYAFIEDPLQPLNVELVPTPSVGQTGSYDYIKSSPLDPPSETDSTEKIAGLGNYHLRLPAIFSWAIKYGVMADMLNKEGEANDPERGQYCEQRYQEGVELARLMVYGVSDAD